MYFVAGLLAFPFPSAVGALCHGSAPRAIASVLAGDICPASSPLVRQLASEHVWSTAQTLSGRKVLQKSVSPSKAPDLYASLCAGRKPGAEVVTRNWVFYNGTLPYPVTLMGASPSVLTMAAEWNRPDRGPFVARITTPIGPVLLRRNIPETLRSVHGSLTTEFRYLWTGGRRLSVARLTSSKDSTAWACRTSTGVL